MEEADPGPDNSAAEWEIVKELLFQWESEQPADLDAWLAERCPTASLRQEVERLARAAATSGDFMLGKAAEEHFGVAAQHPVHIGRYRVIEEIGAGGSGVVYAAYDQALERKVAIKVLADRAAAGSERSKRLRWDAKAASATQHPNIVVIHDIGRDAGLDYIVMECVEGLPLNQLIASGSLQVQTVLKYALQLACGLDAAHHRGVIHRDLKPGNIMITEEGVVKILDFGLARLENPSAEHTSLPATIEGHFAGTVAYVSPEQAEGKTVDARGDIFSFGCILFEMLTGKQAFQGHTAASIVGSILHQPAPTLRRVAPQLDERFEAIVQRCLRKDPDERFPTIAEVKTRLAELVETGDGSPSRFSYRTRKLLLHWGVGAGIAALLAAGAMWFALRQARPKVVQIEQLRVTTDVGLASFPAVSRDGKFIAYASDRAGEGNLDLWVQHWELRDARRLTSNVADEYSPAFNRTGSELVYRSEQDGGGLYQISTLGGEAMLLAPGGRDGRFSPDGHWLAYWTGEVGASLHRGSARIFVMPTDGRPAEEFPPGFDAAAYPVWSATGNRLLFLGRKTGDKDGDWWVAGLQDRTARPTGLLRKFRAVGANYPTRGYFSVPGVWLEDQTVLFTAKSRDATNIWAVRVNADGTAADTPQHWTDGTDLEDYPDAVIAANGSTRTVYAALSASTAIWRIPLSPAGEASGPAAPLISGLYRIGSPSLSWDGGKLAFSAKQPSGDAIQLADLSAQRVVSSMLRTGSINRPVLSGDGTTVAWATGPKGYMMAVKGDAPEEICSSCGPPTYLSFDARDVIFEGSGSSEELLLCARGQKPHVLFRILDSPHWMQAAGRFSPDRRWVVFSGWHEGESAKRILIVPVTSDGVVPASQVVDLSNDDSTNREPVWSPDGHRIYFLSNRDGSECVWACNVDSASGRPTGPVFPVSHFHSAGKTIRGPDANSGTIGLSVARGFLVLTLTETTGNIWSRATLH